MRITLTVTQRNPAHTTFSIHINGGLSGSLILRNEEYGDFIDRVNPDKIYDEDRKRTETNE